MDEHNNAIPVAWAITESESAADIEFWLRAVKTAAETAMADFHIATFVVDDCDAEIKAIRQVNNK